jgi:formylglycine-generating enzyme required for sulfatase activity
MVCYPETEGCAPDHVSRACKGLSEGEPCSFFGSGDEYECRKGLCVPSTPDDAVCGNDIHEIGEDCDDGERNSDTEPDACREDCDRAGCGDGVIDSGEDCDDATGNSDSEPDACRTDCQPARCGDGVADTGEECDGEDLGGQSCSGLGFPGGGTPTCASCQIDASTCCQDQDGDGRGDFCDLGADICDDNPQAWTAAGCTGCIDADGDGYRGTDCDVSADACDNDLQNWTASGCADCTDADGDGHRGTDCDVSDDCDENAPGVVGPCRPDGCPQGWVHIAAGDFEMGCNIGELGGDCDPDERPRHTVTLSAYCMEVTEVSVGAFRACVTDGVCAGAPTFTSVDHWCNYTQNPDTRENHPVNCVTWFDARQYCQFWMGGDLPTEAQWEKAARGTDARKYPWGNTPDPDCTRCNFDDNGGAGGEGCFHVVNNDAGTWEVGYVTSGDGDSPYGLMDTAGNVWEWALDWYGGNFYDNCTNGCTDPVNTDPSSAVRIRRGGSFMNDALTSLRVVYRNYRDPGDRYNLLGFRCRRVP